MFGLQRNRGFEAARKLSLGLLSEKGEANARSMAVKCLQQFETLDAADQLQLFTFWAEQLSPDPNAVFEAAQRYLEQRDSDSQIELFRRVEPPRQELFRRLNRAAGGVHTLVRLRERLLVQLKSHPKLRAVDSDMQHLFNSWFNPGFLELHEITWASPARLLEKIIQHESVHAIDGWDDLRRRLQPDRRCFAFFHPQLPDEPLIFVEVALLPTIPRVVGPLLDKRSETLPDKQFKCAIFYSISNCQQGLAGISFGNFLIKRVAEQLARELPNIKDFATLSPIPGLRAHIDGRLKTEGDAALTAAEIASLQPVTDGATGAAAVRLLLDRPAWWDVLAIDKALRPILTRFAARFLTATDDKGRALDRVAHFHLGNGAIVERLNWLADTSANGLRQSYGLMVNYRYKLSDVDANHEAYATGKVVASREVRAAAKG